jgi:hypothetical protein
VTPYGGILRHTSDYARAAAGVPSCAFVSKSHTRRIPDSNYLLDGLPLACMYSRPIPRTASALRKVVAAGVQPLLPTAAHFTAAQLALFGGSAFGFMANTAPLSECNVRVVYRPVLVGRRGDPRLLVPVLQATRQIAPGQEILCPYNTSAAKLLLASASSRARVAQPDASLAVAARADGADIAALPMAPRPLLHRCPSAEDGLRRQRENLHAFVQQHAAEYAQLRYSPWTVVRSTHRPLAVDVRCSTVLPSILGVFLRHPVRTGKRSTPAACCGQLQRSGSRRGSS